MHPSHQQHLGKLNRIIGQTEGIKRMIDDQKYCVDIMMQIKAVRNALKSIELHILETHMESCLHKACQMDTDTHGQVQKQQIADLIKLLKKYE